MVAELRIGRNMHYQRGDDAVRQAEHSPIISPGT